MIVPLSRHVRGSAIAGKCAISVNPVIAASKHEREGRSWIYRKHEQYWRVVPILQRLDLLDNRRSDRMLSIEAPAKYQRMVRIRQDENLHRLQTHSFLSVVSRILRLISRRSADSSFPDSEEKLLYTRLFLYRPFPKNVQQLVSAPVFELCDEPFESSVFLSR